MTVLRAGQAAFDLQDVHIVQQLTQSNTGSVAPTISGTKAKTGTYSLRLANDSYGVGWPLSGVTGIHAGYWLNHNGLDPLNGTNVRPMLFWIATSVGTESLTHNRYVAWDKGSGELRLYVDGLVKAGVSAAVAGLDTVDSWHYLALAYKQDNSTGFMSLYVNGVQVLTWTGDTQPLSYTIAGLYVGGRYPGSTWTTWNDHAYVDDLWVDGLTAPDDVDAAPDKRQFAVGLPNGVGANQQWGRFLGGGGDTANWQVVDETPPDRNQNSFVYDQVVGHRDTYAFSDPALPAGTLAAVSAYALATTGANLTHGAVIRLHAYDGATYAHGSDQTVNAAENLSAPDNWVYVWERWTAQPDASAWTQAAFYAMQFGVETRDATYEAQVELVAVVAEITSPFSTPEARVSQFGILVEYSPDPAVYVSQFGLLVEYLPVQATPNYRQVAWRLWVDWDRDGVYSEETAYLVSARGQMRIATPESSITNPRGQTDQAGFTLHNGSGRFSALNSAGPLYSAIGGGGAYQAPIYLDLVLDGGDPIRLFTGVVRNLTETPKTSKLQPQVELDCRSRDDLLLQDKRSTLQSDFAARHDSAYTEEQIIAALLSGAGLVDGTDFVSQAYHAAHPGTPATLDPGLFVVPWSWLDDESVLEEIWQLAGAHGGRFYCGRDGTFRYENMQHWVLDQDSPVTLSEYAALYPVWDDKELFSDVALEVSGRDLLDAQVVWEPDTLPQVPPAGGTYTLTARWNAPLYRLDAISYDAGTSGGQDIKSYVSLSSTVYAQRAVLTFTNTHPEQAALIRHLQVVGVPAVGSRGEDVTAASTDPFWTSRARRTKSIRGNLYLQSAGQAQGLAAFLRDRYQTPRLLWRVESSRHPDQDLGDKVELNEAALYMAARRAFVTGRSWTLNRSGYQERLELLDGEALYPYQDASPGYFMVGTHTLGAGSANPGRIFY